jgi:hypothetical protein
VRLLPAIAIAALLAGCASGAGYQLVPGESTVHDVEMMLGRPSAVRELAEGETIYWYTQLPYGRANYAARIDEDGTLVALEQRLVEENIKKVVPGLSSAQVFDLLGPPYWPENYARLERTAWTYPMYVPGHMRPKWFVVYLSNRDQEVVETYLMDDPSVTRRGFFGW